MKLADMYDGTTVDLFGLRREHRSLYQTEPENHSSDFPTELLEILLATINGRNDCEIIDMTPGEVSRFVLRLRAMVNRRQAGQ